MTGSVTLSLEVELAWGQHDVGGSAICSPDRSAEERYLRRLLDACDEHGLPVTFNVVGHLLLDSCDGTHGGLHEEGWFSADPGTNAGEDPLFYWPEVTELIRERETAHELATHTFSHVLCDEVDDRTLAWELGQCVELHADAGLEPPRTLVTPRHRPASYDVVRDAGILGVRALKRQPRESTVGRYAQRARYWVLDRGHPAYEPTIRGGIAELYTTPYPSLTAVHMPNGQLSPLRAFQEIPLAWRKRVQQSYLLDALETAIVKDSNVHLWTHLYNLSNEPQWSCIAPFLERLGEARRNREVEVLTMAELADRYR